MKFRKACWLALSRVFDREPALIEQLEVFSENNIDGDIGVFSHQLPTHGVFMLSSEMQGKELDAITKLNDGEDLFKALGLQASISQKFGLRAPSKEISGYCRLWKNRRAPLRSSLFHPGDSGYRSTALPTSTAKHVKPTSSQAHNSKDALSFCRSSANWEFLDSRMFARRKGKYLCGAAEEPQDFKKALRTSWQRKA